MLNHGYLAQRLRRPLPTKDGYPAHRGRCGQLYCRTTGRSASDPLGPHCSTSSGYGGPIGDQPPARTRVVLRSSAQPQNAHLNIVVSRAPLTCLDAQTTSTNSRPESMSVAIKPARRQRCSAGTPRLSAPKNPGRRAIRGRGFRCVRWPCSMGDPAWLLMTAMARADG